eukprot:291691-Chlamydomonas_euryale.AAC.1
MTFPWVVTGRLLTIFGPCFLPARADLVPPERRRWASLASEAEGLGDLVAGCCCCKVNHHHHITQTACRIHAALTATRPTLARTA